MLGDDNHTVAIRSTYTPNSYPSTVEINIYTFTRPSPNINTVPTNVNLHAQWLPQPCRYQDTPCGNCNTESVNTHISIRPVAISEQLLVQWQ